MKKLALHWKILIGMVLGIVFGLVLLNTSWGTAEVVSKVIPESKEIVSNVVDGKVVWEEVVKPEKQVMVTQASYFVERWIKPFGDIFINLLKLIAVPLILASLIKGISDLKDISKIKKMGLRTIMIYVMTTVVAIVIGLSIVNIAGPGVGMSDATKEKIKAKYETSAGVVDKMEKAQKTKDAGPLQALVDIFPKNIFVSLGEA